MDFDSSFEEDCKELIRFLDDTKRFLSILVEDRDKYILVRFANDQEFVRLLGEAWSEAHKRFQKVRLRLRDPSEEEKVGLISRGLTGAQLEFKLYVFGLLKTTYFKTRTKTALHRVLGFIDIMLKSLSGPFDQIDAIGEIKEILERLLKK